uniref:Uncharacterized protein n=1 Tax=Heliothis virescens TaxID=7102 RepID=A0A2A4J0E0_HELVI
MWIRQGLNPVNVEGSNLEISVETSGQDNTDFLDSTLEGSDESYLPSDYEDTETELENVETHRNPRPMREKKKPERFGFSNLCMIEETYEDATGLSSSHGLNPVNVEGSNLEISVETSGQDNTDFLDSTLEGSDESYLPSDYEDTETELENVETHRNPRPMREKKKPERFGFSNLCMIEETYEDATGLSLSEALQGPEKEQWKKLCGKNYSASKTMM